MGGRTVAEIAALRPQRALGAVLIDPALGAAFDRDRRRVRSAAETRADSSKARSTPRAIA